MRRFFNGHGFLEVETPIRIRESAPEAHIEAVPVAGGFLHTSPELCMKRLLAEGFPRIFQICRCFREGERGGRHLPEFTLLEWYEARTDYRDMMDRCEALIRQVAGAIGLSEAIPFGGREIRLAGPWPRLTVREAFCRFTNLDPWTALSEDRFDEVIALAVEPALAEYDTPVFLCDYPSARGALARLKGNDPSVAERFELYMGGMEICNAFGELIDPAEQRARFEAELAARKRDGRRVYPMPDRFLTALRRMPEASGNALGLDRLVMVLAGAETIDQVVAFPPESL